LSVTLEGSWRAPGEIDAHPLRLETDLARGELQSTFDETNMGLEDDPLEIGPSAPSARIRFIRPVASLFDGIDFSQTTARNIERGVLRNLAEKTRFLRE